ncbi:MAG: ArsR family transcriptional regulator [Deltaproteobacteria bacterium]|nr:MAG: ArsR family transcriptional regulator [Deltaproteobacteria bacterium]
MDYKEFGLTEHELKCLKYLLKNKVAFAKEIERKFDLRQPQVSTALKNLMQKGWVDFKQTKKDRRGRPQNVYYLIKTKEEIFKDLEKTIEEKRTELIEKFEKLKQEIGA